MPHNLFPDEMLQHFAKKNEASKNKALKNGYYQDGSILYVTDENQDVLVFRYIEDIYIKDNDDYEIDFYLDFNESQIDMNQYPAGSTKLIRARWQQIGHHGEDLAEELTFFDVIKNHMGTEYKKQFNKRR